MHSLCQPCDPLVPHPPGCVSLGILPSGARQSHQRALHWGWKRDFPHGCSQWTRHCHAPLCRWAVALQL